MSLFDVLALPFPLSQALLAVVKEVGSIVADLARCSRARGTNYQRAAATVSDVCADRWVPTRRADCSHVGSDKWERSLCLRAGLQSVVSPKPADLSNEHLTQANT